MSEAVEAGEGREHAQAAAAPQARPPHEDPSDEGLPDEGEEQDEPEAQDGGAASADGAREPRRGHPQDGGRHDRPQVKLFLEGRYRKLVRDLPQTVFFCPECKGHPRRRRKCARCEGWGKLTKDSVQELVGWVVGGMFRTRKNKFHGAGREDVDVRMLGAGRPFVIEVINPKVLDVDLAAVEAEINRRNEGRLEIRGLHHADKSRVRVLKETPHSKEYGALVELAAPVEPAAWQAIVGKRYDLVQQTPERVAHRRADKARERWVEFLAVEPRGPLELYVTMRTEHGTYVKEAVNGEGGMTRPSLTELLGVPCHCAALDVLEILDAEEGAGGAPKADLFGAGL